MPARARVRPDKISKPIASILTSADRMQTLIARRLAWTRLRRVLPSVTREAAR